MENFDLKGFVEQILLYFLRVFVYFGFAEEADYNGFYEYVNGKPVDAE
ncbi:MAG: hypothetical protein IJN88_08005 [Clostridia bacterium]|nr:hypothetical protein [Clostridia bacterium]